MARRAPRNRTIELTAADRRRYQQEVLTLQEPRLFAEDLLDRTIQGDLKEVLPCLPDGFVDLVVADPPYNLGKNFNGRPWPKLPLGDYQAWLKTWLPAMRRLLQPHGSIYVCCDWCCSAAVQEVLEAHFVVRSRITWEREKGRGAKANWKNAAEDIWFATVGKKEYVFNVDAVKLKRRVIAPYKDAKGKPKDWSESEDGRFRLTHPSNLWTDLTVPFWSMPENTDHPTQKPEKLLAKIILASSNPGDVVFDPFLGSGTTSVVAKKLGRRYLGIELDEDYCCLAQKRLALADEDTRIQGYDGDVFYERNSGP